MLSSSHGIDCPGCFFGAATPRYCGDGVAIKDGRGYGPYRTGYYFGADGKARPYGPGCERLSSEYDFTPGPNGSFLPTRGAPRQVVGQLAGSVLGLSPAARNGLVAGGLLLAAAGLAYAILSDPEPSDALPRRRRRARRRAA